MDLETWPRPRIVSLLGGRSQRLLEQGDGALDLFLGDASAIWRGLDPALLDLFHVEVIVEANVGEDLEGRVLQPARDLRASLAARSSVATSSCPLSKARSELA